MPYRNKKLGLLRYASIIMAMADAIGVFIVVQVLVRLFQINP